MMDEHGVNVEQIYGIHYFSNNLRSVSNVMAYTESHFSDFQILR